MKASLNEIAGLVSSQATQIVKVGERFSKERYFIDYARRWADPSIAASSGCLISKLVSMTGSEIEGSLVIDCGCKYGEVALVLLGLGARKVIGIDIVEEYVEGGKLWSRELGLENKIQFVLSPSEDEFLPKNKADFVLLVEVISHVNLDAIDDFLVRIREMLKPGGWLLLSDGNNSDNPRVMAKLRTLWNLFENGPTGAHFDGHTIHQPLRDQRYYMVKDWAPHLEEREAREIAGRTCYLWGEDIKGAVQRYVASGEMPDHVFQPNRCPVHPDSGAMVEYPYSAFKFAARLDNLGFRAQPLFITDKDNKIGASMDLLGRLAPCLARYIWNGFRIVAQRL